MVHENNHHQHTNTGLDALVFFGAHLLGFGVTLVSPVLIILS